GSGGVPRQATAWETEARSVPDFLCTDREHGGTRAVSRRIGSPREPRSEGPKALLQQNQHPVEFFRRRRMPSLAGSRVAECACP
ncbi:MAG: hypothetical protein L0191_01300, partial [Acidobacteria bacterium]|nr:hypothetical protein [Acidobacteriota bacterium]